VPPIFVPPVQILYPGLHWGCKLAVVLTLTWAVAPSPDAAAVWIGAQTPTAHRWVQAGVAAGSKGHAFLYAEWNRGAGAKSHVQPWRLTRPVRARLERRGNLWRAGIGNLWTPWVRLRHVKRCTTLELAGGAHAAAIINGKVIAG
jgi:hypothetical protein